MIKRLLLGVVAVMVVVVVLAVLFVSNLDVNLYKDKIQQAVFDKTGRQLNFGGDINLSFFPWIGLQLNDVALANAEGFDDSPFAQVRASDVKLELLPLIAGELNVDVIELHGLQLNLHVNADGVANWEDLLDTTTVVETETAEEDVLQAVEAGAPLAAALSVGGIVVTDSSVRWQDDKNGNDITVEQLNLTTDAIQLAQPFDFTAGFRASSQHLGFSSSVEASGALALDLATNSYTLTGLNLTTANSGSQLPLRQLDAAVTGDLLINLKAQTFDLTEMSATVAGVPVSGEVHGTGFMEALNLFGNLTSTAFDAGAVLNDAGIKLPKAFDQSLLANSAFYLEFQQSEEQLLVNRLGVTVGDIQLTGDMQVSNLAQSAVLSGQLSSNVFNPAPWMASFGVVAADPLALQSGSLSMAVRQSGQILTLNDLRLTVDGFDLTGHVELTDIHSTVPPLVFELHGTELDVDRYLPETDLNQAQVATSNSATVDNTALPVEMLRDLSINGELRVDRLIYSGVTLSDMVIPVRTEARKFEITEARASLYEGGVFGSVTMDLNTEEPLLTVTSNVSAVQSAPLLADYLKSEAPISGSGILNLDMLTRGASVDQWLQQANGALSLRFTDGAINGINIGREVRRASALVAGADFTAQESEQKTDFSELSVSAEINEGVLLSEDLSFKSPLLRMSGRGSVNLPAQQVDYLATVLITANTEGQGGEEMVALDGLSLPVPVKGSFSDLSVDFTGTLINALRSDFVSQLQQQKEALLEAQKEKAQAVLKAQEQALKDKLQEQQDEAEALLQEKKEVVIDEVERQQQVLEQQLEDNKEKLEETLQQTIEKGISNLLEK